MLMSQLKHPNSFFFFFNDTATTEIYTLSLHDALPISTRPKLSTSGPPEFPGLIDVSVWIRLVILCMPGRSEEHTSELQSRLHLVCRLLLEKKKTSLHAILNTDLSRIAVLSVSVSQSRS